VKKKKIPSEGQLRSKSKLALKVKNTNGMVEYKALYNNDN